MVSTAASVAGWVTAGLAAALVMSVRRAHGHRMEAVARACHELRGPLTAARLGLTAPGGRDEAPSPRRLRAIDTELSRAALALDDLAGAAGGGRAACGSSTWWTSATLVAESRRGVAGERRRGGHRRRGGMEWGGGGRVG